MSGDIVPAPSSSGLTDGADEQTVFVGHRCDHGCGPATGEQVERLIAAIKASDDRQASEMPTEHDALRVMFNAFDRLRKLGWREAIYCPKDGTVFEAIEAGSTGIHDCHYDGEWPNGYWWVHGDGDLWPSRPILFRLKTDRTDERSKAAHGTARLNNTSNNPALLSSKIEESGHE